MVAYCRASWVYAFVIGLSFSSLDCIPFNLYHYPCRSFITGRPRIIIHVKYIVYTDMYTYRTSFIISHDIVVDYCTLGCQRDRSIHSLHTREMVVLGRCMGVMIQSENSAVEVQI